MKVSISKLKYSNLWQVNASYKEFYKAKFCGKELQRLFYRAQLQGGVTGVQLQGRSYRNADKHSSVTYMKSIRRTYRDAVTTGHVFEIITVAFLRNQVGSSVVEVPRAAILKQCSINRFNIFIFYKK